MTAEFSLSDLTLAGGLVGLCSLPAAPTDLAHIQRWRPDLVVSLTPRAEMEALGAGDFWANLGAACIDWRSFPIADYGVPDAATAALWPGFAALALGLLARGGRVLVHCRGGCGRSGMVVLRLMIEAGEDPAAALTRLRRARPCAVETKAQLVWAAQQDWASGG
ncbi:MAG: protein-tyrosine phosphatase family protein [Paracoccaceae bacterium]|nr:protein-tyrosine phosphatase family protein [Paracoccaceae bacterium]